MSLSSRSFRIIAILGLTTLVVVAGVLWVNRGPDYSAIDRRITGALIASDRSNQHSVQRAIAAFNNYFRQLESRKFRRFASDSLDLHAEFDTVWDALPFTSGKDLQGLLAEDFRDDVLSPKILNSQINDILVKFGQREASADNLLRRTWIDELTVDDAKGRLPAGFSAAAVVNQQWDGAMKAVYSRAGTLDQTGTASDVASLAVSSIAAYAITDCGVGLGLAGTDGSIMGVGAAGAPETFGISAAAALGITYGVSWLYDQFAQPQKQIRKTVVTALEKIRLQILDGSGPNQGLIAALKQARAQNMAACRSAARKVIKAIHQVG